MTPSHDDLSRSLGRVEGEILAMKDRMDRLESFIEESFREFRAALDRIEKKQSAQDALENQRKGASRLAVWIAGSVGGLISWLATHFIK